MLAEPLLHLQDPVTVHSGNEPSKLALDHLGGYSFLPAFSELRRPVQGCTGTPCQLEFQSQ